MRLARTYTIELELIKKLKLEDNASDLINRLLTDHYKISEKTESQILKEVKEKIAWKKGAKKREVQKIKDIKETAEVNKMLGFK